MWEKIVNWYNNVMASPIYAAIIKLVFLTVIIFVAYQILNLIIRNAMKLNSFRKKGSKESVKRFETSYYLTRSILRYFTIPVYIIFALPIIGVDPSTVFASAGVVGIVVSFAFQDLLKDVVAGLFIVFERIYEVDDYIEVNGFSGTVVRLGVKTTVIKSFTGEICTMNNRDVGNVRNFTKAEQELCINYFTVSYDTDIQDVYKAFKADLKIMTKNYPEIVTMPTIMGANALANNGIEFQVNTIVKPEAHWQFRRSFNVELISMCKRNGLKSPRFIVEEESQPVKKVVKKNGKN